MPAPAGGELFIELADALCTAGVQRAPGIADRALLATHLGEVEFRGKERRRIHYAILAAFAVHGGLEAGSARRGDVLE